jgi:hypothetical protein
MKKIVLLLIATSLNAMDKKDKDGQQQYIELKVAHEKQQEVESKPAKKSCLARLLCCCCKKSKKVLPQSNISPQKVPALYALLHLDVNQPAYVQSVNPKVEIPWQTQTLINFNKCLITHLSTLLNDPKVANELGILNDLLTHFQSDKFDIAHHAKLCKQGSTLPYIHPQSLIRKKLEQLEPELATYFRRLDEPVVPSFKLTAACIDEIRQEMQSSHSS